MRDNEKKRQYLNRVTEKINLKQAKYEIVYELDGHIDERAQFYEEIGYTEEEAFEKAVEQMGDPERVGISMARLHPKEKMMEYILLGLALCTFLGFWLVTSDNSYDGIMPSVFGEFLYLFSFFCVSLYAQKRKNFNLSISLPVLFSLSYGWYAYCVCNRYHGLYNLCSPLIFVLSCILTGDFTALTTFSNVGRVTVAPCLTYVSIAFYALVILLLLILASVSVWKLHRPPYSLADKRAGKVLAIAEKSVCGVLALILLLSWLPFETSSEDASLSNSNYFNCVVVLQSDLPCALEDVKAEDVWIIKADYDWSEYIYFWFDENHDVDYINVDEMNSIYTYHSEYVMVPCGSKLRYAVQKASLKCKINKPYVTIHFIQEGYNEDDLSVTYRTLAKFLPETLEWQESADVGTVSATIDTYNIVDVVINTEP